MNLKLSQKNGMNIIIKIVYVILIIICIVAIAIGVYIQFFSEEKLDVILGINKFYNEPNEIYEEVKTNFDNIFTNKLNTNIENNYNIEKIDETKELIYTEYEKVEVIDGKYDLNVNLPCININDDKVIEYNDRIKKIFQEKAESIIINEEIKDEIYVVQYSAYINSNILSLIIKTELKEGTSAQRIVIQTYNYNLQKNREATIEEILEIKGLQKDYVIEKIQNEIKIEQQKAEELQKLGYNIYSRDYTNEIYLFENIKEYFIGNDGYLYLIYAYGNDNITSEMDLIIF